MNISISLSKVITHFKVALFSADALEHSTC